MFKIGLFVEDFGHETFLRALLTRLSKEYRLPIEIKSFSVRGGHGKVLSEFEQFLKDVCRDPVVLPDLLLIAVDANCHTYGERKKEIEEKVPQEIKHLVIAAIPDPHIERWMLLDSASFKRVLGKGCSAPDLKCERDRYKRLLIDAVKDAGLFPLFGGMEHAEDIVNGMDIIRIANIDNSFGKLMLDLGSKFKEWQKG